MSESLEAILMLVFLLGLTENHCVIIEPAHIDPQHFVDFLRDALARWCRPTISRGHYEGGLAMQ